MTAFGAPVRVAVAIHNHQPVGNFDSVFSEAVERAYRPFLEALARHPGVRISMHWSGSLLEWLEEREPSILDAIGALCVRGQVELLSGAFYEPILAVIPPWDQQGQIERMNEYLKARFGVAARGAWIAERVWEPGLPEPLARVGIEYTLLDDHHFLLAGADPASLRQPYWVESTPGRVGVFPIERELRYRIPFQSVPDLLEFFRESPRGSGEVRVFGDDGEKFGIWPRTHDWVYREGWLEAWLTALEERRVIEALPLREIWDAMPPRASIALPSASYPEMMLWSLPPERQVQVEEEQRWLEDQGRPELARRVATGTWRQFLARYPESRRLHRRVSELSARVERLRRSCLGRFPYEEARREVHRAQCNCSYWHGVFGGFYLPHLREAVEEHMLRADQLADELTGASRGWTVERDEAELRLKSPLISVSVGLEEGGAITELVERRRPFDFAGVIARRREAYHAKVTRAASLLAGHEAEGKPETIHGAIQLKESGLARLLEFDERNRFASQEWVLPEAAVLSPGRLRGAVGRGPVGLRFSAAAGPAGPWIALSAERGEGDAVRKEIAPGETESEFAVSFAPIEAGTWLVSEWNLSLLTGDAPGRRLLVAGPNPAAFAPGSSGEADGVGSIRLEDSEFLKVALTLSFEPAARVEWAPVETVSLSEGGAERVYQGTSFLFGFRAPESGPGEVRIRARIEEVTPAR